MWAFRHTAILRTIPSTNRVRRNEKWVVSFSVNHSDVAPVLEFRIRPTGNVGVFLCTQHTFPITHCCFHHPAMHFLFIYLLTIKTNKQTTKQTCRFYLSPNDAHWQVKVCFWSPTLLEIAALPTGKFQIRMKWKEANQRWHTRQQLRENAERRNRTCNFICHHEAAITPMWRGGNSASAGSRWLQEARLLVDWISGRNWRVLFLQKSAIFS